MDSNRIKAVIDLQEYLITLGNDRPPLGAILKALAIEPQTMQDAVIATAHAAQVTLPEFSFHVVNEIFKLGVTIGYKYAVKKTMEQEFGMEPTEGEPN